MLLLAENKEKTDFLYRFNYFVCLFDKYSVKFSHSVPLLLINDMISALIIARRLNVSLSLLKLDLHYMVHLGDLVLIVSSQGAPLGSVTLNGTQAGKKRKQSDIVGSQSGLLHMWK